jgi:uncharacterized protein (DUF1800 family)
MNVPSATPLAKLNPEEAWKPWQAEPFTVKWAVHLFRRAAFGAPAFDPQRSAWDRFQQAVQQGLEPTLDQLLAGGPGQAEFDQLLDRLAPQMTQVPRFTEATVGELQGWWLYRMLYTPHPLRERMTLFWHNHFATSFAKVKQPGLMLKQNQTLRSHALGRFRTLLLEVSRDPAMLIWLDSNSNIKGRANENYARELMELFSLGVGHYTETDVREAARAFTGWYANGEEFVLNSVLHDDGPKTILGQTGNWQGGDVVRVVLEQPAAARFLVRKLYCHFISETEAPPDSLLEPLAEQFRRSDYDLASLMRTLLQSRLFFSEYAYRQRVKSPVEYVVGLLASLDGRVPFSDLAAAMEGLGQTLFAPPNVKGWTGGKAWLNSATLLARHNMAWSLVRGNDARFQDKLALIGLVRQHGGPTPAQQVDFLLDLFLQGGVSDKVRQKLVDFLGKGQPKEKEWEARLRETAHTILLMPEYQLA